MLRMPTMPRAMPFTMLEMPRLLRDATVTSSTSEHHAVDEPDWTLEGVPREAGPRTGCRPTRLLGWYADALEKKPLLVKCISSGLVGALGDMISQCVFWGQGGGAVWHDKEVSTIDTTKFRE